MVGTGHTLHIQILHTDGAHLAVVRQCIGDFVKAVLALVGDMFLEAGNLDTCLIAVGRAFLFPAQVFLQHSKAVQAFLQVLRILKYASV